MLRADVQVDVLVTSSPPASAVLDAIAPPSVGDSQAPPARSTGDDLLRRLVRRLGPMRRRDAAGGSYACTRWRNWSAQLLAAGNGPAAVEAATGEAVAIPENPLRESAHRAR